MITAIDTNVLLDVLLPNPVFLEHSKEALVQADDAGALLICTRVYGELCVHFPNRRDCDGFLSERRIQVEDVGREAAWQAARAWKRHRRAGGKRDRILADFLIGAHAAVRAARLLSRDRGFYRTYFPDLELIDPSAPLLSRQHGPPGQSRGRDD